MRQNGLIIYTWLKFRTFHSGNMENPEFYSGMWGNLLYDEGQDNKPAGNNEELNVLGKRKGREAESYLRSLNEINFSASKNLNENITY